MAASKVAIIGGGLAGLAAAAELCSRGFLVELFEAKRRLGGRAGSFTDPTTGELIDHCQHVVMGCCTEFQRFCQQTGVAKLFRREQTLHFFGPDGWRHDMSATPLLPAPLHLASSLLGFTFLTWRDRLAVARGLLQLAATKTHQDDDENSPTIGEWLRRHKQSAEAMERFWGVVLVSALGETLDRASLAAARKVFVDGFMRSRAGYQLLIPTVPLSALYEQIADWLTAHKATIHLESPVKQVIVTGRRSVNLRIADGSEPHFDHVIIAVPWRRLGDLFDEGSNDNTIPAVEAARQIASSPITSVHLWFDRRITPLRHAVLVGRLSQWIFYREATSSGALSKALSSSFYYQVVISASRELAGMPRDQLVQTVVNDLHANFPDARLATLQHARVVTEQDAVFSYRPGLDKLRPSTKTTIRNVFLAGDWTATGWPATMESAVRSGVAAAKAIGDEEQLGRSEQEISS